MRFYDFMLKLCNWLVANHPGSEFLITIDNLNIHKDPMIIHFIYSRGHRVVFQAPYLSRDGSIDVIGHGLMAGNIAC
jgi:hypothetical protein